MWRDRWLSLGIVGVVVTCLACLTPVAVIALGAIGFGAWAGRLDLVLWPMLAGFLGLILYRARARRHRFPAGVIGSLADQGGTTMEHLEMRVGGMSCGACEARIERALAQLDGVVRSTASHARAEVTVLFDPRRTSAEAVRARVEQAGYEVRP